MVFYCFKFRLHILDNNSSDVELLNYLEDITKDIKKGYLYKQNQQLSLSDCYNLLFTTCQESICVLFPVNCIVDNYWLEDLISSINSIENPGCVCIKPLANKIEYSPVLTNNFKGENILENVIQTSEQINSVIAVKSEVVTQVGKIDSDLNATGFELSEFALRVKVNGFNNFYIRKQSVFKIPFENSILFPEITKQNIKKFKETVNLMFKYKRFKK
jgi:hypothetical protein